MNRHLIAIAATVALTFGLVGCEDDSIADSADKAADKIEDTTTNLGNRVEDACEEIKEGMNAKDDDC